MNEKHNIITKAHIVIIGTKNAQKKTHTKTAVRKTQDGCRLQPVILYIFLEKYFFMLNIFSETGRFMLLLLEAFLKQNISTHYDLKKNKPDAGMTSSFHSSSTDGVSFDDIQLLVKRFKRVV